MCWAVPAKLVKIEGKHGIARLAGIEQRISLELIRRPVLGGYVLIHAGYAIQKVDKSRAKFTEKFFRGNK